jgi:hypothetical protein
VRNQRSLSLGCQKHRSVSTAPDDHATPSRFHSRHCGHYLLAHRYTVLKNELICHISESNGTAVHSRAIWKPRCQLAEAPHQSSSPFNVSTAPEQSGQLPGFYPHSLLSSLKHDVSHACFSDTSLYNAVLLQQVSSVSHVIFGIS